MVEEVKWSSETVSNGGGTWRWGPRGFIMACDIGGRKGWTLLVVAVVLPSGGY